MLHRVFELERAVRELHRVLRGGGALLVGVPTASAIEPEREECWRLTPDGLRRLLEVAFPKPGIAVRGYGNALTAALALRGLAASDFRGKELAVHDERFPLLACARAWKFEAAPQPSSWEEYASRWRADQFDEAIAARVRHLGDEWTYEELGSAVPTTYGLSDDVVEDFGAYLEAELLDPYLPAHSEAGLEIGPGGGRLTELLVPRAGVLHVAEPSPAMLAHLRRRFAGVETIRYHRTDGTSLPDLRPESIGFVAALDVFVHLDPWLTFSYLRQAERLLEPGGVGIVHYANPLTPIGWRRFEATIESKLGPGSEFGSFAAMSPELMGRFLSALGLEVVSEDVGVIPRDAVAVFRKRRSAAGGE